MNPDYAIEFSEKYFCYITCCKEVAVLMLFNSNSVVVSKTEPWSTHFFRIIRVENRAFSFGDRKPHKHRDKLGLVKIEEFLGFKHDKSSKRKSPGVEKSVKL